MKRTLTILAGAALGLPALTQGGELEPTGSPSPTMATLEEIAAGVASAEAAALAIPDHRTSITPDPASGLTITEPGSYVLAGNVTMTADVTCITIATSDVTIDLNGHRIVGPGLAGTASGIDQTAGGDATVRNGTIISFPQSGIRLGGGSVVRDVNVRTTGGVGVEVGPVSALEGVIQGNSAGGDGIVAGFRSKIVDCIADGTGGRGIVGGAECEIRNCQAAFASAEAISAAAGCHVIDCEARNGLTGGGIAAGARCLVRGNIVRAVTGFGISADLRTVVASNQVSGLLGPSPAAITLTGSGAQVDGNSISDAATGVDASGSSDAWIVRNTFRNVATPIAPGTNTSAAAVQAGLGDAFFLPEPWANFEL